MIEQEYHDGYLTEKNAFVFKDHSNILHSYRQAKQLLSYENNDCIINSSQDHNYTNLILIVVTISSLCMAPMLILIEHTSSTFHPLHKLY